MGWGNIFEFNIKLQQECVGQLKIPIHGDHIPTVQYMDVLESLILNYVVRKEIEAFMAEEEEEKKEAMQMQLHVPV